MNLTCKTQTQILLIIALIMPILPQKLNIHNQIKIALSHDDNDDYDLKRNADGTRNNSNNNKHNINDVNDDQDISSLSTHQISLLPSTVVTATVAQGVSFVNYNKKSHHHFHQLNEKSFMKHQSNQEKNFSLVSVVVIVDNNATTIFLDEKNLTNEKIDSVPIKRHFSLALAIVPLLTVFGNALVIIAVYRERSLQTVTNLLIVSLAVSDFLVAICVMSFAVYFEWNAFVWNLGPTLCNLYIGADVACSTASILNLLAISLDRFIAIKYPLTYTQYGSNNTRGLFSIFIVWAVSLAVGLPVFFGANNIEQNKEHFCEFTNPYFIIISSILSFFVPCGLMIVLYAVIFQQLRARERARSLRHLRRSRKEVNGSLCRLKNEKIGSALMSGARWHCQVGTHFKTRTDQMLMELSLQTSSFPTLTPSASSDDNLSMATRLNGGFITHSSLNCDSSLLQQEQNKLKQDILPTNQIKRNHLQPNEHLQERVYLRRCNTIPFPNHICGNNHKVLSVLEKKSCYSVKKADFDTCSSAFSLSPMVSTGGPLSDFGDDENNTINCDLCGNYYQIIKKESASKIFDDSLETNINNENDHSESQDLSVITEKLLETTNFNGNEYISSSPPINMKINDKKNYVSNQNCPFGEHLENFLPFIDSLNCSEESLTKYCCNETDCRLQYFCMLNGTTLMKHTQLFPPSTPPTTTTNSLEQLPQTVLNFIPQKFDCHTKSKENIESAQVSDETVLDKLLIKKEFSSEIKSNAGQQRLTLSQMGNNINNKNYNNIRQVLGAHEVMENRAIVTPLITPIAQKKETNQTKLETTQPNCNNSNNNNIHNSKNNDNSNSNNNKYSKENSKSNCFSSMETIAMDNGWRRCCLFGLCYRQIYQFTSAISRHSNISSISPSGFMMDGPSTILADFSSTITTTIIANRFEGMVDKNNNEKKKTGFDRCLTLIGNFCRELWDWVYVRNGRKMNVQTKRPSRQLVKKASKQMKREQKATVTLAVVLVVFLVCWVPFFTLHLSNAVCMLTDRENCVHFLAMFLSTWLGYLNSSLNPLIYTVFDQRFRKAFRNILKC